MAPSPITPKRNSPSRIIPNRNSPSRKQQPTKKMANRFLILILTVFFFYVFYRTFDNIRHVHQLDDMVNDSMKINEMKAGLLDLEEGDKKQQQKKKKKDNVKVRMNHDIASNKQTDDDGGRDDDVEKTSEISVKNKGDSKKETTNQKTKKHRYAYSFVIGEIHETQLGYKGFLYNILITVNLLQKLGSEADFLVWTQLSPNSTLTSLPEEDREILEALGIEIFEMEKPSFSSFSKLMYDKFLPLKVTKYKRIMYLDSDVLPLVNLDYYFHLSDPDEPSVPTILRPNMNWASRKTPCNGGMFMMHPDEGAWELLQKVIDYQHEAGKDLEYPHFHWQNGWGHNFRQEKDVWEASMKIGTSWRFHGSHTDQGLWFYYSKYVKQDVSFIIGDRIQNWVKPEKGSEVYPKIPLQDEKLALPVKSSEMKGGLLKYSPDPLVYQYLCDEEERKLTQYNCIPPFRDIAHFMGKTKPWQVGNQVVWWASGDNNYEHAAHRLWFRELEEVNTKLGLGLDIKHWNEKHRKPMQTSPLGYKPKWSDNADKILHHETKNKTGNVESDKDVKSSRDKDFTKEETQNDINNNEVVISPQEDNTTKSKSLGNKDKNKTIAYAISFIKCGNKESSVAGLVDASLVLRHSVHQISSRNPKSGSKYDYKLYAIVHRQAESCSSKLKQLGYEVRVVDPPVLQEEIKGEFLKKHIHKEWCCGSDEFVKLFAYTLPEEVIVHVDIDFAFYKPMDNLFDAILYDKDSPEGKAARAKIELERPTEAMPDVIAAFITRDWPQVAPKKFPPAYQAGFLVARRDPSVLDEMVKVIREGHYTEGWGYAFGWGEKGYGGYVGAMAMQGLVAYYYDHIRTNTAVELNQCRYNHMGMDVLYRNPPNFRKNVPGIGGCRNALDYCEDCMITEFDQIYSVHYTQCRKPWSCVGTGGEGARAPRINSQFVNIDHCLMLHGHWHDLRTDFENQLFELTGDELIKDGASGTYMKEVFQGHCGGEKDGDYKMILGSNETFSRVEEMYTK